MGARHWTDEDFINKLYGLDDGLGGESAAHLAGCPQCAGEWDRLLAQRKQVTAGGEVSNTFLAAQRRTIYQRIEHPSATGIRWVPAFAALLVLIAGFFAYQPASVKQPLAAKSDDAVFSEVYALEQSSEPAIAQPMQGLFENN